MQRSSGEFMHILKSLVLALLLISTASCGKSGSPAEDRVRQRLVGTWLNDTDEAGVKTRTVIDVAEDGGFHEFEKIVESDGSSKQVSYAGDWSFDGTNFKRKYTSKDGQPLPRSQVGYATYAVNMSRDDEFLGVDNVQQKTVKFSRTGAGMRP